MASSPIWLMRPRSAGRQLGAEDAAGALGDVDHEVAGALDLGDHADGGDDAAQVAGHGLLQGELLVAELLELDGQGVERVVALDDAPGRRSRSPSSSTSVARGMPSVTSAAIWTISWRISSSVCVEALA